MNQLKYSSSNFLEKFGVLYILSLYGMCVFILQISNSQYVFSSEQLSETVEFIKLVVYGAALLGVCVFYRISRVIYIDLLVFCIFAISFYHTRTNFIIILFLFVVRNIRFSLIIKAFLIASMSAIFFVLMTFLLDVYRYHEVFLRHDGEQRLALGFKFATYLPNLVFFLFLSWFVLRKGKISNLEILIGFLLNCIIFVLTDTKTSFYLINLLIVVSFFIKIFSINYSTIFLGWLLQFLTKYSFLIFAGLSLFLVVIYDPQEYWMDLLNKALSGRLYYGHKAYVEYGISLFGQKIEYIDFHEVIHGVPLFVLDLGYVRSLLDNGLALFMLITIGMMYLGRMIVRFNQFYLGLALIFVLIEICINPHLLYLAFNPFIFLLGYYSKARIVNAMT